MQHLERLIVLVVLTHLSDHYNFQIKLLTLGITAINREMRWLTVNVTCV